MRFTALVTAALMLGGASSALALEEKDILGVWRNPDTGSLIRFYPCGDTACAKIAEVDEKGRKDTNNPDPALRNRPVVGIVIMNGGKKVGPLTWRGSLYNWADGGTYNGTLTLTGPKTLKLSGCILGGLICADRIWTKVE